MTRSMIRALLLVACLSGAAQAQLGGLIRKAAGKAAEKKIDEKINQLKPVAPLEGDPVTATDLDGLLKGLAFELGQQAEAAKLGDARLAKVAEYDRAEVASHDEAEAYLKTNSTVMSCVKRSISASNERHQVEIAERMMNLGNDPNAEAMIKQFTDVNTRLQAAMQKQDTAAFVRLSVQMLRVIGVDIAKDSALAYKECGKPPAMPASYVKTLRLQKEAQDLNEDLRKVELNLFERAAKASGMDAPTYLLARERVWAWNDARKSKVQSGVTKDEEALFKSRTGDIVKVEKALR